jgi:uncharacterized protein YndB with AHSA1/START domain
VPIPYHSVSEPQALAVDWDQFTITLRRTFAAPREQVFEAWTQPEHVACWWDPTGVRLVECEIDLRPGGNFKFVNAHHGPAFIGTYRAIVSPSKLVFEALGAVGAVDLQDVSGKTYMTVTIKCRSHSHLEEYLKMGVDVGTARTLDNLVAYMEKMKP